MRTFYYTAPEQELKALKSGIQEFISKPKGICSWHKGDRIVITGWKDVIVKLEGTTTVFFGNIPDKEPELKDVRPTW